MRDACCSPRPRPRKACSASVGVTISVILRLQAHEFFHADAYFTNDGSHASFANAFAPVVGHWHDSPISISHPKFVRTLRIEAQGLSSFASVDGDELHHLDAVEDGLL